MKDRLPSVAMFHVRKMQNMDYNTARQYLRNNNFYLLGEGCEAYVYTRSGFEYVIKVLHDPHPGNPIVEEKEIPSLKHFIPAYGFEAVDYHIVVQKKIKPSPYNWTSKKYNRFSAMLSKKFPRVSDTLDFNCGLENGTLKCFDWCES